VSNIPGTQLVKIKVRGKSGSKTHTLLLSFNFKFRFTQFILSKNNNWLYYKSEVKKIKHIKAHLVRLHLILKCIIVTAAQNYPLSSGLYKWVPVSIFR